MASAFMRKNVWLSWRNNDSIQLAAYTYIIYVNSSRQDDTELGRLMKDFHCSEMDEIYNEGAKRGRDEGIA